mmetsp:Transcript_56262/g.163126  ORF Transcript_56262/g.163126 Transcript_56262/m.163126 type:complete len:295 (+) Transcript_56262:1357-2241(+)
MHASCWFVYLFIPRDCGAEGERKHLSSCHQEHEGRQQDLDRRERAQLGIHLARIVAGQVPHACHTVIAPHNQCRAIRVLHDRHMRHLAWVRKMVQFSFLARLDQQACGAIRFNHQKTRSNRLRSPHAHRLAPRLKLHREGCGNSALVDVQHHPAPVVHTQGLDGREFPEAVLFLIFSLTVSLNQFVSAVEQAASLLLASLLLADDADDATLEAPHCNPPLLVLVRAGDKQQRLLKRIIFCHATSRLFPIRLMPRVPALPHRSHTCVQLTLHMTFLHPRLRGPHRVHLFLDRQNH